MIGRRVAMGFWWLVGALSFAVALHAQGGATGALSATVQDASGAVVVGAKVEVVSAATEEMLRSGATNASGVFTATLLPAGAYSIRVSSVGFGDTTARDIVVRVTETTRLTVTLSPKVVTQTVEVRSEAVTVETADATMGQSLGGQVIGELPLATRNFQQLLALSPGTSSSLNAAAQLGRGVVKIQVNGGREDNNNYQIEGIGANDATNIGELANTPLPSPDAIQEFKVATSLYDATQGRNGGGNINAILKSGSSVFHFDAFEYFRNTVLDANDFFLKRLGLDRPVIQQNIFGGSVGGPVGSKAKLGYFFLNYQGTRQRSGDSPGTIISTAIPYVPAADRASAAALASDFGVPSVDPVAFALVSAKSDQFGPKAGGYTFPLPTSVPTTTPAGTLVPFAVSIPGRFDDDQFTADWDRDFGGGKDRLSERFFSSDSDLFQPFGADSFQLLNGGVGLENNLDFPLDQPLRNRFASLAETHIFNDHVVNEARFGVNVISFKFLNIPPANTTATALGINRSSNNVSQDMYRIVFSDINVQMGPFPSNPVASLADGLTFLDTVSYTRGSHTFRLGGEIDHTDVRRFNPIDDDGFLFFFPFAPGQPPTGFQNFLEGNIAPGSLAASGLSNHDYKIPGFALFAQDDFRITKTLTLNLGFRMEWVAAPYDALCHQGNVDPKLASVTGQPFFWPTCINQFKLPGVVGTAGRSGFNNNYATVPEPRIGFAYDVLGHHTTSVRAGYGIYSVREDIGSLENMILTPPTMPQVAPVGIPPGGLATVLSALPPVATQFTAANLPSFLPFIPTPSLFEGFSADGSCVDDLTTTTDTTTTPCFSGLVESFFAPEVPRHYVAPTIQQWNLSVERSLGKGWTLQVGYVGTKGSHLREVSDTNQAMLVGPGTATPFITLTAATGPNTGKKYTITENTAANIAARVPYLGISPFGYERFGEDANSHYDGLQVNVSHRLTKSLSLQSAYTYSKSIDDTSTSSVAFDTRLNNQLTGLASRGPSDFDRRHRWTVNYDYAAPFLSQSHLLGGWEVSGVFTLQSGAPFTVFDGAGGSVYGLSSPDLVTPVFAPGFSCSNALTTGSVGSRLSGYINPSAFLPAPAAPNSDGSTGFGNVPRNCFRGPHQVNLDFSIGKAFRLGEHQQLKFTTEFFNLTNTPSFANPAVTDIEGGSAFGKINQVVGTPRLIQFALRYAF